MNQKDREIDWLDKDLERGEITIKEHGDQLREWRNQEREDLEKRQFYEREGRY